MRQELRGIASIPHIRTYGDIEDLGLVLYQVEVCITDHPIVNLFSRNEVLGKREEKGLFKEPS